MACLDNARKRSLIFPTSIEVTYFQLFTLNNDSADSNLLVNILMLRYPSPAASAPFLKVPQLLSLIDLFVYTERRIAGLDHFSV